MSCTLGLHAREGTGRATRGRAAGVGSQATEDGSRAPGPGRPRRGGHGPRTGWPRPRAPGGPEPRRRGSRAVQGCAWGTRDTRGEGERGGRGRERERERREGSSPWDPKTGDNHPPDHLGQRGGRERWKKGRGSCCAGKTNEREGEGGAWGGGVPGSRGGAPGRAGLGRRSG
jgi:translation initiation factor IF-2